MKSPCQYSIILCMYTLYTSSFKWNIITAYILTPTLATHCALRIHHPQKGSPPATQLSQSPKGVQFPRGVPITWFPMTLFPSTCFPVIAYTTVGDAVNLVRAVGTIFVTVCVMPSLRRTIFMTSPVWVPTTSMLSSFMLRSRREVVFWLLYVPRDSSSIISSTEQSPFIHKSCKHRVFFFFLIYSSNFSLSLSTR